MSLIAYVRVSSVGQNVDTQIEKLEKFGCKKIFTEKISGIDQNRPQLLSCLQYLRDDEDVLVITRLDRLARSATHLGKIVEELEKRRIDFIVLDQHIDTTTSTGKLMFQMLAAFAEFENNIRRERQMDGIRNAIKNGKYLGRPKKRTEAMNQGVVESRNNGMSINNIMTQYDISKTTVYRILSEAKANDKS